ncbi:MAG: tetratricopeptide repeat protein [Anaerolineae bacterium]
MNGRACQCRRMLPRRWPGLIAALAIGLLLPPYAWAAQGLTPRAAGVPAFVRFGFYAVFFLSILGAGVTLRQIYVARRGARRDEPPAKLGIEGVDVAWDVGLVPATLADEQEPMPAEVEEALAELDRYVSPIPPEPRQPMAPAPKANPEDDAAAVVWEDMEIRRKALESWMRRATPEDAEDLMREGIRLAKAGETAQAYDIFSTVTRLVPDYVEAWLWKGGTALHPQESVRCLQRALELDPDNPRARQGLAWALARLQASEDGQEQELE